MKPPVALGLGAMVLIAGLVLSLNDSSERNASARSFDSRCGVFPGPGEQVSATAPSLPDQRAWNQGISRAPVAADSNRIIDYINSHGGNLLHPDFGSNRKFGIPFTVVGRGADPVPVRFRAYGDESDHGRYRIPLTAPIEGSRDSDGDRHAIAYDKARCRIYELYRSFPKRHRWNADSGVIWDTRSAARRKDGLTSADAAGLPVFAGLVRYQEVRAGRINHAIRVTFESTRDAWIHPASHCAGDTASARAPAMGTRLRLRTGYDISGMRGQARVIAKALKAYGFLVADNGSNWFFQGAPDRRWKDGDLNQLKEIPGSAFEVVRSQASAHAC